MNDLGRFYVSGNNKTCLDLHSKMSHYSFPIVKKLLFFSEEIFVKFQNITEIRPVGAALINTGWDMEYLLLYIPVVNVGGVA